MGWACSDFDHVSFKSDVMSLREGVWVMGDVTARSRIPQAYTSEGISLV